METFRTERDYDQIIDADDIGVFRAEVLRLIALRPRPRRHAHPSGETDSREIVRRKYTPHRSSNGHGVASKYSMKTVTAAGARDLVWNRSRCDRAVT